MDILKNALKKYRAFVQRAQEKAWARLDSLSKPIGSLGILEDIAARMLG